MTNTKRHFNDTIKEAEELNLPIDALILARTGKVYFGAHQVALRLQKVKKITKLELFELEKAKDIIENLINLIKETKEIN